MQESVVTWTSPRTRALAYSKQFLTLVEATADPSFAVDTAGRIRAWNKAAAEFFGPGETEVMGVRCHELFQCSDENGTICSEHCIFERAAQENYPMANFDLRVQTKRGKLWCNVSTLIATDAVSGVLHAIHIVRQVELRKRLEQALSEFVRRQSTNDQNGEPPVSSAPKPVNVRLTSREVEVLKSMAKGHSTKAIANQLNISSATVNNHIKHILTKFNAHTRLQAIRHAESAGVI
jgi:PAS domain S-box-containing protein